MSLATLAERAGSALQQAFGRRAAGFVQAPGRVNLIGEHTDYNGGFVLPAAIDRHVVCAWAPRDDGQVRVVALDDAHQQDSFSLRAPIAPEPALPWSAYVRGMARELHLRHQLPSSGADLAIVGDVPAGAGLSSSAALELAVAHALLAAASQGLDATTLALAAQRAENEFVGCRCGVMDQLVSARGEAGHALLIDCRSLLVEAVPLPAGSVLLIAHSRVRRGLVASAYNERRAACERAAAALGVAALRDASAAAVEAVPLDDSTRRRARHVVSENERTQQAAFALAAGDLYTMGRLMAASHTSMRDDFEITVPAIDDLVALIQGVIGSEGGARMTGGGFGGCVVALLPHERVAAVRRAVETGYVSPAGEPALLFEFEASAGAGPMPG
jgi:galactokinase